MSKLFGTIELWRIKEDAEKIASEMRGWEKVEVVPTDRWLSDVTRLTFYTIRVCHRGIVYYMRDTGLVG